MIWVAVAASGLAVGQDAAPKPRFEVASIRPFNAEAGFRRGLPAPQNPEHLVISAALRSLIQRAYRLENYQVLGPGSIEIIWDVAANAAPGTTQEQANLMLQSLLEERFHLTFHHEMKEFKVYNLVPAKGGVKLKESISTDGCSMGATSVAGKTCGPRSEQFGIARAAGSEGRGTIFTSPSGLLAGKNADMALLAREIRQQVGEIVTDKTGLSGGYDLRMQCSLTNQLTHKPFDDDSPLPSIFDALQQQLGLKLDPAKTMIEVMVIDHVDAMPTDNWAWSTKGLVEVLVIDHAEKPAQNWALISRRILAVVRWCEMQARNAEVAERLLLIDSG
jgi:uncharacterized protein (TIGR03435 family)